MLAMVVLFLFAIAVAATAGYQMVNAEFALSQSSRQGQRALVVARAGLERYLGEQLGAMRDSMSYAIQDGVATITTHKVYERDADNHLYWIRSEGAVADLRAPDIPATRVVGTYAWHRIAPLPHEGMIFITDRRLRVVNWGTVVSGLDASSPGDCAGGGTPGVYGVVSGGQVQETGGGDIRGNPGGTDESYSGWSEVYDSMNIRWDILTDPEFPVDYDNAPPANWSSIPADSFPISRYEGDLLEGGWGSWSGGHGVLIVTGRLKPRWGFSWSGIILAGRLDTVDNWNFPYIRGLIFAGMNGAQRDEDLRDGLFQYDYCQARGANEALSYLERVDHAVFELN